MGITERIKAIREVKRIKQIDVAASLNLDPSYYARLEKRGEKMSIEQLQSIADALEVSLGDLLGTVNESKDQKPYRVEELEKRIEELEKLVRLYDEKEEKNTKFLGYLFFGIEVKFARLAIDLGIIQNTESAHKRKLNNNPLTINDLPTKTPFAFPYGDTRISMTFNIKEIQQLLPHFTDSYPYEYQIVAKMYDMGVLPKDNLRQALDLIYTEHPDKLLADMIMNVT